MRSGRWPGAVGALVCLCACTGTVGGRPELTSSGGGATSSTGSTTTNTGTGGVGGGVGASGGAGGGVGASGGAGGQLPVEHCSQVVGTTELVEVDTPMSSWMCIDATEVTKGQYESWLNGSPAPTGMPAACDWNADYTPQDASWPPGGVGLNEPVVGVDWCDALGYCLDHGKRLCGGVGGGSIPPNFFTDASNDEWFNACSEQGNASYPYGSVYNSAACNGESAVGAVVDVGSLSTCSGSEPVFDLSGNVWEWEDSCNGNTGSADTCRVRGGAFDSLEADLACGADLVQPRQTQRADVGFRCCADPVP